MAKLEVINSQPFLKIANKYILTNWSLVKKDDELFIVSIEDERVELYSFNETLQDLNDIEDIYEYDEIEEEIENGNLKVMDKHYNKTQRQIQNQFKYKMN